MIMVGDGATDMEAKNSGLAADLTVGFGGVIEREITLKKADWFVYSFKQLIDELWMIELKMNR